MLEKDMYQKFKKKWSPKNYIKRIEPKFTGGIPDLLLVSSKTLIPIFVEMKVIKYNLKQLKVLIRTSQIIWFTEYPGIAYILVGISKIDNKHIYCLFDKSKIQQISKGMNWDIVPTQCIITSDLKQIANYLENCLIK